MRNQEPWLCYHASDTYGGSLLSFLGIDPEQVVEKKIVLRVLIMSTFEKTCPAHVPLWLLADHTDLRKDIFI